MGYRLASVTDVRAAIDAADSAQADALIARHLGAASESVENRCNRTFTPWYGTRYFPWPNDQMSTSWRLWLDAAELAALPDRVEAAGVEVTDYFCEPINVGPPFNRIELDLATSGTFAGGLTPQRAIAITGWFGYSRDTTAAGTLVDTIDENATAVTLSRTPDVGQLLVIDSEYVEVTALDWVAVTSINGAMADDSTAQTVTLGIAVGAREGELLMVGAELVRVRDVVGATLVVERAAAGSTLAAHLDGTAVFARRAATIARGAAGTTPASHAATAAVARHLVPDQVVSLVVAETLYRVQRDGGSWAVSAKMGLNPLSHLDDLRASVYMSHGRRMRKRAI